MPLWASRPSVSSCLVVGASRFSLSSRWERLVGQGGLIGLPCPYAPFLSAQLPIVALVIAIIEGRRNGFSYGTQRDDDGGMDETQ